MVQYCLTRTVTKCLLFVVFGFEFSNLGILLGLHAGLTLIKGELRLALECLVRRVILLGRSTWVFTNLLVNRLVKLFKTIGINTSSDKETEVLLVLLVILLVEVLHVLTDVSTKDTLLVHLSIVFLSITVVTRESLLRVRNIETTISTTLQGTEDTATGSGSLAPNIEKASERTLIIIDFLDEVLLVVVISGDNFSINLGVTLIDIVKTKLLKKTTGTEKTSAVSSGVVLQTDRKSVSWELNGTGLGKNTVSIDQGISDLADNLTIGESHNKTVLWCLVLVLVLGTKSLTLTVIGSTLTPTAELHLVTAKVGSVLLDTDESASSISIFSAHVCCLLVLIMKR
mmetsp:Transcript_28508/g.47166  ORF Transcript_28508/g.47166 Transcript_28508/m.47166 type:complete len:342 (+) Transcript_28508:66-1091(+)